mgnify:FL=1
MGDICGSMCFSYAINFSAQSLQSKLHLGARDSLDQNNPYANITFLDGNSWHQQIPTPGYFFSGFDQPQLPVLVMLDPPGEIALNSQSATPPEQTQASIALKSMQWGLIPRWVKSAEKASELFVYGLNARGETVEEKPMFREAWKDSVCLIPASGFFEWKEVNKKKYPYYIQMKDDSVMLMAGICSEWIHPETGEWQQTFSILTTEANALMQEIHNVKKRMPVIFDGPQGGSFLRASMDQRKTMLQPCDNDVLKAHQVGDWLNNSRGLRNVEGAILEVKKDFPQSLF